MRFLSTERIRHDLDIDLQFAQIKQYVIEGWPEKKKSETTLIFFFYFILIAFFILMSWRSSAIAALPLNQDRRTHRQLHNTHSLRHCHLPQLRLELRIGNSD